MYTNNNKNGFVILVAVLVSTLVISIGAFIASVAIKELQLSASGRESQNAFYAADSALECALYHDLRVEAFGSATSTPPADIYCDGKSDIQLYVSTGDEFNSDSRFRLHFLEADGVTSTSPYAIVRVQKSDVGTINDKTIIEAKGYNVQDPASTVRVERALQVVY